MNWRDVPVPELMRELPRDRRGLPVPHIVFRDANGDPHFTINDSLMAAKALVDGCCAICGQELGGDQWFIGGPLSAFHCDGGYLDPPVHEACGEYAMKVCPYLAAPRYGGRIDTATLSEDKVAEGVTLVMFDNTMIADRPVLFVMAQSLAFTLRRGQAGPVIIPQRPWHAVRFWLQGRELSFAEAEPLIDAAFESVPPEQQRIPRGLVGRIVGSKTVQGDGS